MARIRVNTEDLKEKAKDFDSAADAFKRAGDEILAAAMAMPSYDGQLSGPARKMGYEFQKQARDLSTALAGDAELLRKTAQDFENVDHQTVELLSESTALLSGSPLGGGPGGEEDGNKIVIPLEGRQDYIGYEEREDTITLWMEGKSIVIDKNDPKYLQYKTLIDDFRKAEQEFCKYTAELFTTLQEMINRVGILLVVLLFIPLLSGLNASIKIIEIIKTAFPEIAAILNNPFFTKIVGDASAVLSTISIKEYADLTKKFQDAANNLDEAYTDGKNIWDKLNQEFGTP